MSNTNNYFSLFGLALDFDIDLAQLRQRYRELQTQAHPDRFSNGSTTEKRAAVEQSALLNDGYQVLTEPVERAKHLFKIISGQSAAEHNLASEPAFLMLQIEAREQLALFKEGLPHEDDLDDFIDHYEALLGHELVSFKNALSAKEYDTAEIVIAKIQLFTKLLSEAQDIEQAD